MGKRRTPVKPTEKPTAFREGQPFCPVHEFGLYKAIRASPELPAGAKVTWEALVEKTYKPNSHLHRSYDALARDIGLKRDQAKRYVRMLIHARMLRVTSRFKGGHQESNHIEFLWRDPGTIAFGRMGSGREDGDGCESAPRGCKDAPPRRCIFALPPVRLCTPGGARLPSLPSAEMPHHSPYLLSPSRKPYERSLFSATASGGETS